MNRILGNDSPIVNQINYFPTTANLRAKSILRGHDGG